MIKHNTTISGLYCFEIPFFRDIRGSFQKVFNNDEFLKNGLIFDFKEFYFTLSHKNVIRGMHFQNPPHNHAKVVSVSSGRIMDVVLDIRKDSTTYGKYYSIELDSVSGKFIYIPSGFAHGFKALEHNSIVNYLQTSCYSSEHDTGILYNSFGFDWGIDNPIVSERDNSFIKFNNYTSVF